MNILPEVARRLPGLSEVTNELLLDAGGSIHGFCGGEVEQCTQGGDQEV